MAEEFFLQDDTTPVDTEKLKSNFDKLKASLDSEIIKPVEINDSFGISPMESFNNSAVTIYDKFAGLLYFRTSQVDVDFTGKILGQDYFNYATVFNVDVMDFDIEIISPDGRLKTSKVFNRNAIDMPKRIEIAKLDFLGGGIIFVPKNSNKNLIPYNSLAEVIRNYDLYRPLPHVIKCYSSYSEFYKDKIPYRKLELIK